MSRSAFLSRSLLAAGAIAFIGVYITLSYYNRAVSDDLLFLWNMRESGWFHAIATWPLNIRWGSYMLFNTFFFGVDGLQEMHPRLVLFQVFVLITSIGAFILLLKTLKAEFGRMLPVVATLMVASLFFFSLQYGEVWFWAIGACVYILPMISSIMLIGLIFYQGTIHLRYLWILLFSALSFGGLESWALFSYGVFLCLAIAHAVRHRTWRISDRLAIVVLTGAIMGILTLWTSHIGHRMVMDKYSVDYFQNTYGHSKYRAANIWKALGHPRFPLALLILLSIPPYKQRNSILISLKKYILTALPILIFVVVVTIVPLFIVYDSIGETRAWSPISTVLWMLLAGGSLLVGWHHGRYFGERTQALGAALIFTGIVIYGYRVIPHARDHASAYDVRSDRFRQACHEGKEVFVTAPLPDPGVLISGDLERDPNGIYNESLGKLLGVECQISQTPH